MGEGKGLKERTTEIRCSARNKGKRPLKFPLKPDGRRSKKKRLRIPRGLSP
jgi:hypothetical protein